MDVRHGDLSTSLDISGAFSTQVNTGVPVEIVEAENQTVESVLTTESDAQDVSAGEAMELGVDTSTKIDSTQLSAVSDSIVNVARSQLSAMTGEPSSVGGHLGTSLGPAGQLDITTTDELLEQTAQLTGGSIGAQLSGGMGVSGVHRMGGDVDMHTHLQQVPQSAIDQLQRSLIASASGTQALEISSDAINFANPHTSLGGELTHDQSQSTDASSVDRARQILGSVEKYGGNIMNYSDVNIGGMGGTVDPSLTVSPSVAVGTATIDSSNVLNEPESPCSPESNFDSNELLSSSVLEQDEVTHRLAQSGPVGVAAAAAIMTNRKRKRSHMFESNPALRKRHRSKLTKRLKETIEELSTRVGLQAVVVTYRPGKTEPKEDSTLKVFGAAPLINAVCNQKPAIITEMEASLNLHSPPPPANPRPADQSLFELPSLIFDGMPTPVHKMTQAQLRAFIPNMLKYSSGRGKPGWGKEDMRPAWWPAEIPWDNVRSDVRDVEQKKGLPWTDALRRIVISCYLHHGRMDLLPEFSFEHLQHMLSPEAAEQLQVQLEHLQQQSVDSTGSAASTSQPPELISGDSQQVFTVDTGAGTCDTSGMPTLADASLAETAARLQQVADETGQVQYATQTVTVTDRDAKALGQPVGSTTTVLLTAYPGGHSGAMETSSAPHESGQQFLAPTSSSTVPNVQVVYSASHIESIPDSVVSSIATQSTSQTHETFSQSVVADKNNPTGHVSTQRMSESTGTEYLNSAVAAAVSQGVVMVPGVDGGSHTGLENIEEQDLASQLINEYVGSSSADVATPASVHTGSGLQADTLTS